MLKWIEATGRSEDAAIQNALAQLGLDRDSVSVEVLERARSGFLGFGSSPAKVKVTYEVPDEPAAPPAEELFAAPPAPQPKPERTKPPKQKEKKPPPPSPPRSRPRSPPPPARAPTWKSVSALSSQACWPTWAWRLRLSLPPRRKTASW